MFIVTKGFLRPYACVKVIVQVEIHYKLQWVVWLMLAASLQPQQLKTYQIQMKSWDTTDGHFGIWAAIYSTTPVSWHVSVALCVTKRCQILCPRRSFSTAAPAGQNRYAVANPWFPAGFWLVRPRVLVPVDDMICVLSASELAGGLSQCFGLSGIGYFKHNHMSEFNLLKPFHSSLSKSWLLWLFVWSHPLSL